MRLLSSMTAAAVIVSFTGILSAQAKKENVPGIVNFAQVETTVACGGAITPAAVAEIKARGFKSVFNLQMPEERNANVQGEQAAAAAAGLTFVHVPFNMGKPEAAPVDRFLAEIAKPANNPAFIHCAGGVRAAGFWAVKRLMLDKWPQDKALAEAESLGMTSPMMKDFVLGYVKDHQK